MKRNHSPALWIFILCCASLMSLSMFMSITSVYLTTLSSAFGGAAGLTKEELGRIPVFSFFGIIATILIGGSLADRLGPKIFTVCGNWLIALGMIFCASASSYGYLLASMFVIGLGCGFIELIMSPVVISLYPARSN